VAGAGATVGGTAGGIVLNIGGEGEVPGAINFQGPWILGDGFTFAGAGAGLTPEQLQAAGNQILVGTNDALPFAPGSVDTVITNNVPILEGGFNYMGPTVWPSQIWQVLSPTGQWINNGAVVKKP
jgi:hypothetical protein